MRTNILSKIKGLVIEEVPSEQGATAVATEPTNTTLFVGTPSNNGAGAFDQQIYDSLTKAISEKDLPGNDYLEYKASLKNLQAAGLNEEQMFKAAYAVLSANGLTKDILFKSLDLYLGVLDNEKETFKNTILQVTSLKISGKQKELADNDLKAEELRKQLAAIESQAKTLQAEIAETKNKIASTEANFNVTLTTLVTQLTTDKDKISKYIA